MSGLDFFDGNTKMRVTYGARTVLTTDGTLINLLPSTFDVNLTFNVTFPDIIKGYWYNWKHLYSYTSIGGLVGYDSSCTTALTACPQEFEQETNLVAAPSGADIFVGSITLSRTSAPSHTWNGATIQPKQPTGVSIPFISGSLLMEAEIGMARAMSIYISGGQLKLNREQSVSTPPGGWGQYGSAFSWINPGNGGGGENVHGGTQGIPIIQVDLVNVPSYTESGPGPFNPAYDQRTRQGGPNACAIPNPSNYNYSSTYQAVLTGSFGRRS